MRIKFIMSIICILLAGLSHINAGQLTGVTKERVCQIQGTLESGEKIRIYIEMEHKGGKLNNKQERPILNGAWSRQFFGKLLPIYQVHIRINNNNVLIPNSALSDIASVREIEVHKEGKRFLLTMECGEGGDSSTATFNIEESKRQPGTYQITERKVSAGGFKDDVWERTVYHNNMWDNLDL